VSPTPSPGSPGDPPSPLPSCSAPREASNLLTRCVCCVTISHHWALTARTVPAPAASDTGVDMPHRETAAPASTRPSRRRGAAITALTMLALLYIRSSYDVLLRNRG
jgi:hypothetical protein